MNLPKDLTFEDMVRDLAKSGKDILTGLGPQEVHLIHMVLGISGEAGELLDAVKKHAVYKKHLDRENIVEELGDLEFYMEGLRSSLGISRAEVIRANMKKLGKRYEGFKYTDAAAQTRADKIQDTSPHVIRPSILGGDIGDPLKKYMEASQETQGDEYTNPSVNPLVSPVIEIIEADRPD